VATAASQRDFGFSTCRTILGHGLTYSLENPDLAAEPVWEGPGTTPPPLDLQTAIELSRRELPEKVLPQAHDWTVQKTSIESICCPKRWFYVIGWLPKGESGRSLDVPVLMSGRVGTLMICGTVSGNCRAPTLATAGQSCAWTARRACRISKPPSCG